MQPRWFRWSSTNPVVLAANKGKQRFQRFGCVAVKVDLGGIPQRKHRRFDIDLHGARAAVLGQKFGPGEASPDHQVGIAALHQVPAWLSAEQSDRGRLTKGRSSGSTSLPSSALATPAPRRVAISVSCDAVLRAPIRIATLLPAFRISAARE